MPNYFEFLNYFTNQRCQFLDQGLSHKVGKMKSVGKCPEENLNPYNNEAHVS